MITHTKLYEVLQKDNMWNQHIDGGIERSKYLDILTQYVSRKEIIVLKGIRRCGKSTLMKQLMLRLVKQNVSKEQIVYVNLESYEFRNSYSIELFERILEVYRSQINSDKKTYFFIDEIQTIPLWERFLRTMYDRNEDVKFIVSGSNASLLSQELSTLLTGRNITIEVRPLSYDEYKLFTLHPRFEEYLLYGGFPEVVLEQDPKLKQVLLEQYFEDIIQKDVIQRHRIRNGSNVRVLAKYLIENSGTRCSFAKLGRVLQIDKESVERYIYAMQDAYLFLRVNHFSYSFKKRFDKSVQPKYYVSDTGFFHVLHTQKSNRGSLFENLVAVDLTQRYGELMYYLDSSEVDFIVLQTAINVTVDTVDIKKREFQGLIDFSLKHKKFSLVLVTPQVSYVKHPEIDIIDFSSIKQHIR